MAGAEFRLSPRARRILAALAPIVCGADVEELALTTPILEHVERTLGSFPAALRAAILAGLNVFELSAAARRSSRGRRFSQLPRQAACRHYESWWSSRFAALREIASLLKATLALAYYEQPPIRARLGYDPDHWISEVAQRRLARWSTEIRQHEAELLAPDPLVSPGRVMPSVSPTPGGGKRRVQTRDDFAGGELVCDVVVVGSGAGGAVVAAELAAGGLDVIVLEEGGYHPTEEFTTEASTMVRKLYRDGGMQLAFGTPPISFNEGKCVGGSTVINGGMSWRTPEQVLRRWQEVEAIEGIGPAAMERYFARVERYISAAPQDPGSIGRDNELFREGAERKGWKVIPNIRNQLHCAGCNNCVLGCPTGAKRSTLVSYLPRALAFGARVHADCRVERILLNGKQAEGVTGHIAGAAGRRGAPFTVRASRVVVAAGAMHTPALLARSGIRSPSGRIGSDLALHPNAMVVALFDENVEGWKGVHQGYQLREFQDEGLLMAAVNLPPAILATGLRHYGPALSELMQDYNRIVTAGVLVEDTGRGRVRALPSGQPIASYALSDMDADRIVRGTALLADLLFAAGARRVILPFEGVPDLLTADDARRLYRQPIPKRAMKLSTVHIMGTARMGGDLARHVCDSYGQVYDSVGLVVADASLFPSPIGVNPMETIMALATRNAERILENWTSQRVL
ncbi:MAG: GMC family oxidoreductase [Chloroflexota bacterium]|nr:GMC family oxidoreductase [Chloroflexota bacterium]